MLGIDFDAGLKNSSLWPLLKDKAIASTLTREVSPEEAESRYFNRLTNRDEEYPTFIEFMKLLVEHQEKLPSGAGGAALSVVFIDSKMHLYLSGHEGARMFEDCSTILAEIQNQLYLKQGRIDASRVLSSKGAPMLDEVCAAFGTGKSSRPCAEKALLSQVIKFEVAGERVQIRKGITFQLSPAQDKPKVREGIRTVARGGSDIELFSVQDMAGNSYNFRVLLPCKSCTHNSGLIEVARGLPKLPLSEISPQPVVAASYKATTKLKPRILHKRIAPNSSALGPSGVTVETVVAVEEADFRGRKIAKKAEGLSGIGIENTPEKIDKLSAPLGGSPGITKGAFPFLSNAFVLVNPAPPIAEVSSTAEVP